MTSNNTWMVLLLMWSVMLQAGAAADEGFYIKLDKYTFYCKVSCFLIFVCVSDNEAQEGRRDVVALLKKKQLHSLLDVPKLGQQEQVCELSIR